MPSQKRSKFDDKLSSDMVDGKIIIPCNSDNSLKNIGLGSATNNNGAIHDGSKPVTPMDLGEFLKITVTGYSDKLSSDMVDGKIIIPCNSDNSYKNIELGSTTNDNGAIHDGSTKVTPLDLGKLLKNTVTGRQSEKKEDELY